MSKAGKGISAASRRAALGKLGGLGLLGLVGCGGGSTSGAPAASTASGSGSSPAPTPAPAPAPTPAPAPAPAPAPSPAPTPGSCTLIPRETDGPYPLLAILSNSSIVRRDVREGKAGVPLTMKFRVIDATRGCAPISGAAVYIWHCDKDGSYSGYNAPDNGNQVGKTFLRGVQVTDDNGEASFLTIYPGWYPGRITHIHFQIYFNDNLRTTATVSSQLAFPQEVTKAVYATADYRGRGQNTSVSSIAADGIFSDGSAYQIAAVTGDASSGLTAVLDVGIAG